MSLSLFSKLTHCFRVFEYSIEMDNDDEAGRVFDYLDKRLLFSQIGIHCDANQQPPVRWKMCNRINKDSSLQKHDDVASPGYGGDVFAGCSCREGGA